jgi:LysR family transcriptional regulator (chromosome initiation inhibitor)
VEPDIDQLRALSAAVTHGSLDAAARVLHVTPSAVSQRLRALESTAGQVLLVRSRPVRPTTAGAALVRLARQVDLLLADAAAELGPPRATTTDAAGAAPARPVLPVLPVAVNADSLATWALPALASVAGAALLDVHRGDESRTGDLLRAGTVMAAVSTQARPVAGCRSTRLGALRYRPMAAPQVAARWFADGVAAEALTSAPVVVFDRDDDLQHAYLRGKGVDGDPPAHHVPSSADFLGAILLGMGWGMLPDPQSAPHLRSGALVALDPAGAVDVVLYWQRWALRTPSLDALTAAVVAAAREHLHQH